MRALLDRFTSCAHRCHLDDEADGGLEADAVVPDEWPVLDREARGEIRQDDERYRRPSRLKQV